MRTKTLLLTAAFGAAGLATSMAQEVFSVNSVGYVNVDLPAGFSMIANPLNQDDNDLDTILTGLPDGTLLFKFDAATQAFDPDTPQFFNSEEFTGWFPEGVTLDPGEGAFISLPSAATVTFVGEVPQGNLTTAVAAGFSIVASQVPQAGLVTTDLGFPASDGDLIFQFDNAAQQFDPNTPQFFDSEEFTGWFEEEPTIQVAESFFSLKGSAASWTRNFSVND